MLTLTKRAAVSVAVLALSAGTLAGVAGCSSSAAAPAANAASTTTASSSSATAAPATTTAAAFASLESRYGATIGLYAVDTGSGRGVAYRADDRFAFCSTIKAFTAALLLERKTDAQLDQTLTYTAADLVEYSPVTSQHVHGGMRLSDVIAAALTRSDNTAADLMFAQLGGPARVQAALRSLGDSTTDVDRTEPDLNSAVPGDARDTSTPRAMAGNLRAFVLGDRLASARRAQLAAWLKANTTGGPYIRAGVPAGWEVGDKTGNGDYGARNDIAVLWPPHRAPIVIAVYTHRATKDANSADALIADATKLALQDLG